MIQNLIHTGLDVFLELLFPAQCLRCTSLGNLLCIKCENRLYQPNFSCFRCMQETDGSFCITCKHAWQTYIDRCLWSFDYKDDVIRKAIAEFKYKNNKELAAPFIQSLNRKIDSATTPFTQNTLVIPIPLHPKKERLRGFNQALLLARGIARHINAPLENVLKKHKYTKAQAQTKTRNERLENIKSSFSCDNPEKVKGKTILLIDDVATTGATLNEAAKVLKQSGAAKVVAIIVARG